MALRPTLTDGLPLSERGLLIRFFTRQPQVLCHAWAQVISVTFMIILTSISQLQPQEERVNFMLEDRQSDINGRRRGQNCTGDLTFALKN